MAFESDSWASPALQPAPPGFTIPRQGRRASRYNSIISLDDSNDASRHRQAIAERRSRYDLASTGRDLGDGSPHSPKTVSPIVTLTSTRESAPGTITPSVARSRLTHTSTGSVSHDENEPFLGRASDIQNLKPTSSPHLHQGSNRTVEAPSRARSFLSRLANPRSGPRLNNGGYLMLDDLDPIDEGDAGLVDLSTLGGGNLDLKFLPVPSNPATVSNDANDVSVSKRTPKLDKLVVNQPVASGSELLSQLRRDDNGRIVRADTIRRIGQKLAEREQVIVEVTEAVDLSTLEGTKRLSTELPDGSPSRSTTFNQTKQSYFYPADPEQPNWRPFSMRRPFIILLILLSLGLAGFQEWLCQESIAREKRGDALIEFNDAREVSLLAFFCWKYLPTLIFVSYGVLWQITEYETKRLEPYYQLSQPNGSLASTSLNLDYVSLWAIFVPLKALFYRHWAVFWASTASLFATSVAPSLQNPSMTFVKNPKYADGGEDSVKKFIVKINPIWSRLLTASLIVVAVAGILLYIQLRRKSGLLSDPKGIAGIASMATKSHILGDFEGMDEARHNKIHKRLKHHRYLLYKSTIWQGEYITHNKPDPYAERRVTNPHPLILRPIAGVPFVAFLVFCFAFIPIVNFTRVNVVATTLPWLLVLVATLVKQLWVTLEFALRTIEPFYVLSNGNALPQQTLTLDYRGTPYGLLPFQAIGKGHYIVALAGVGSVLVDILTVTVSSFSVNGKALISDRSASTGDQTFRSFSISVSLSLAILLFLVVSATLIYMRRRHPFLPREPSTIASVLAFIYQSRMLVDFENTERLNNREMEKLLISKEKRYGLGWFRGRDGKSHCAVDEEPMLSRYVHGISYKLATAPWEEV